MRIERIFSEDIKIEKMRGSYINRLSSGHWKDDSIFVVRKLDKENIKEVCSDDLAAKAS